MLQPTLLLVEIILVGVTGYLVWMARRALTEAQKDAAELIASTQTKAAGIDPASLTMAQDVSALLNDLQRTAGSVQADWVKRRQTMQATLARAEAVEERLRDLLAQADQARPTAVPAAAGPLSAAMPPPHDERGHPGRRLAAVPRVPAKRGPSGKNRQPRDGAYYRLCRMVGRTSLRASQPDPAWRRKCGDVS